MKITVAFDGEDDEVDMALFWRRRALFVALSDIRDYIRKELKHGTPSIETEKVLEDIRDIIYSDHNLGDLI